MKSEPLSPDVQIAELRASLRQAVSDRSHALMRVKELGLERDALQQRLAALSADDEDAPTPAGLRAANAQLRKDRQMYSALVGQLRGQLQECEAGAAAMREALIEAMDKCGYCNGSGQDNDGEGFLNAPCPKCRYIHEALSTTAGTALLQELRSLRDAKQPEGNL